MAEYLTPHGERSDDGTGYHRPIRGNWRPGSGVPQVEWLWDYCVDTGAHPGPRCEMCLWEYPRYVHTVHHVGHPTLRVGCYCAAWMTGDVAGDGR